MSCQRALAATVAFFLAIALSTLVHAQGTVADYQRAFGLRDKYQGLAFDVPDGAVWIGKSNRFTYRKTVKGGTQFIVVDADTRQKQPAFDHDRLAAALASVTGRKITGLTLPFTAFTFVDDGKAIMARVDATSYTCSLDTYTCKGREAVGAFEARQPPPACAPPPPDAAPKPSPDKKWEAIVRGYNIALRRPGDKTWTPLSIDGTEGNCYVLDGIVWAPNSLRLVAYKVRPGYRRDVHYVESSPEDQLQPKSSSRFYAKPGDDLDLDQPTLFDVEAKTRVAISSALFPNPYELSRPEWRTDSSAFTFEYNQRGHQVYRVIEVDAATGAARAVISEEPKTFFTYSSKKYRYDIAGGHEVVWMSERDGWNHLYLYDGRSGEVKNQITKGEWVVRGVSKVDEERRQVWFSASGMYPGKDPYFVNYYRVGLDGMGLTRLTEADANHAVSFSSDMKYYVDTYSRVDLAPVSELRLTADGSLVTVVERADITELVKAGWKPPEVFVAAGRDGTTEIWGVIFRVGIYGTSAGGQNSLGALLFHPEFYKATVSAAGCHDNRMDKIWWNEQWMGWPIGPQYAESSNVENAYRLQGALLLVVGEMDTNVDPSSTMQVVNQLIKHDKPFDLLVIPGAGHGSGGAYGDHKRYDFFVRELLGLTPPKWAAIEKNRQK